MDHVIAWGVAGFLCVILELLSGTFYLLVLGIACLGAAVLAYFGAALTWQALDAALFAFVGTLAVRRVRKSIEPKRMPALDIGQQARFDSWVSQESGRARVKYRDALWDAQVVGSIAGESGEVLYVKSIHGNALEVSKTKPA